jgi:hypothetical protein
MTEVISVAVPYQLVNLSTCPPPQNRAAKVRLKTRGPKPNRHLIQA